MNNFKSFPFGARTLDLSCVQIMGVLNVTPDSFSDGGKYLDRDFALRQAEKMLLAGASIIDVGGESTRPGAQPVSEQEELGRVCPIVEHLVQQLGARVSVDTSTPSVMKESIRLGCGMINDVRAFSRPGALEAVTNSEVALCIMHMQGEPETMQDSPSYSSVVEDVSAFLQSRISVLLGAGVERGRLVVDPGFGFGKTLPHNLDLLRELECLEGLGCPILVGMSRKSMIGAILNKEVEDRLFGSVAAAVIAAQNGAHIIRVHDVAETVDAIKVVNAVKSSG